MRFNQKQIQRMYWLTKNPQQGRRIIGWFNGKIQSNCFGTTFFSLDVERLAFEQFRYEDYDGMKLVLDGPKAIGIFPASLDRPGYVHPPLIEWFLDNHCDKTSDFRNGSILAVRKPNGELTHSALAIGNPPRLFIDQDDIGGNYRSLELKGCHRQHPRLDIYHLKV